MGSFEDWKLFIRLNVPGQTEMMQLLSNLTLRNDHPHVTEWK